MVIIYSYKGKGSPYHLLRIIDAIRVPFKVYDDLFVEFRFLPNLGITPADAVLEK